MAGTSPAMTLEKRFNTIGTCQQRSGRESEMPDFDVEAFITKLDHMGVRLTAVPLADGKLRISRWCMLSASEHAEQIQELWSTQIGNNQDRIDALAAHLAETAPWAAWAGAACVTSRPVQIGSPSIAAPNAPLDRPAPADHKNASGPDRAAGQEKAAATSSRGSWRKKR